MATAPKVSEKATSQSAAANPKSHAHLAPAKVPKELKPWQVWFTTLCLPLFISMFACALIGLIVLTDEDNTTWLGQSWFGTQWRRLINFNGFFSAGCLNGGTLIAYVRLKEHQTAKQHQILKSQFRIYKPSDLTQASKQTKKQRAEPKKRR